MNNGSEINGSEITFDPYIITNNSILKLGSFLTRLINNVKIESFKNYENKKKNLLWILLIILLIRILFKKKNEL